MAEPFGEERADLRMAFGFAALAAKLTGEDQPVSDFLPEFGPDEAASPLAARSQLEQLAAALGAEVV
jgi:hypothetical protein